MCRIEQFTEKFKPILLSLRRKQLSFLSKGRYHLCTRELITEEKIIDAALNQVKAVEERKHTIKGISEDLLLNVTALGFDISSNPKTSSAGVY